MRRLITGLMLGIGLAMGAAAMPLTALAGGACRGVPVTDAQGATVHIKGLCFTPTVLHVGLGQTVTWVNDGPDIHTVSGANITFGDYTDLAPGKQVSYRFATSGAYPYYCFLHPGMVGTLVVGDGAGPGAANGALVASVSRLATPQAPAPAAALQRPESGLPLPALVLGVALVAAAIGASGHALWRRAG
ncbi:MAG: plastocyanin/azurin family copper-binding protein [Candidatus Dormibacteria bacterium]